VLRSNALFLQLPDSRYGVEQQQATAQAVAAAVEEMVAQLARLYNLEDLQVSCKAGVVGMNEEVVHLVCCMQSEARAGFRHELPWRPCSSAAVLHAVQQCTCTCPPLFAETFSPSFKHKLCHTLLWLPLTDACCDRCCLQPRGLASPAAR
jgi:hypothetical protein